MQSNCDTGDDHEWAERGEFWIAELNRRPKNYRQKRREHLPLILAGHGVRMKIDNGTLLIRNGFTHHPQKPEQYRYFRGDRLLPSRIVMLDGDGYLTFDVLAWLSEQNIPLIQLDWMGSVVTVGGADGYAADRKLVEMQWGAKKGGKAQKLAAWLIERKLEACTNTLRHALPATDAVKRALEFFDLEFRNVRKRAAISTSKLLGLEGRFAWQYFAAWKEMPVRWRGTNRKPIPDDWHKFSSRVSHNEINRYAVHPVNAMLNYGYATLENLVRVHIVAAGLDPSIGYLHGDSRYKHPLVFDLMEPLRPRVDRAVLEFALRNTFAPGDFTLAARGICRLNPQIARNVVKSVNLENEVKKLVQDLVQVLRV